LIQSFEERPDLDGMNQEDIETLKSLDADTTYPISIWKRGSSQSFLEFPDLSKREKDAILTVLSALPTQYKAISTISIGSDGTTIAISSHYGSHLFYVDTILLTLSNNKDYTLDKRINDNWSSNVWYYQND
jgi:hypothetical protein